MPVPAISIPTEVRRNEFQFKKRDLGRPSESFRKDIWDRFALQQYKIARHRESLLSSRAVFERSNVINGDWKSHATMQAK